MLTPEEFYEWERTSRDTIDVKRCYIDLAGDLVSGILLSQIIYWFLPGEKGSKLRVQKQDRLWLAKGRTEWWDECRISAKQFDRAIKVLKDKNLVDVRRFRWKGSPSIHIWLNIDALVQGVNSSLTDGTVPHRPKDTVTSPSSQLEVDEEAKSLTETTPETTSKTTTKDKRDKPSPQVLEVFKGMQSFYGYPDDTNVDPIPNYGKEGKAIKRLLERGFNIVQILDCWMEKCQKAGQFKSMQWVNEDIGKVSGKRSPDPDKFIKGKYGHLVRR